jgi:hypothetical protein
MQSFDDQILLVTLLLSVVESPLVLVERTLLKSKLVGYALFSFVYR